MISHRLRGFGVPENSIEGLQLATKTSINYFEIDTRHTRDNIIIVYHYPCLRTKNGIKLIREMDFKQIKNQFLLDEDRAIVTLEEFLETFKSINNHSKLCIDIKDFGLENQYVDLITKLDLINRVWIVSWIPETLIQIHHLLPEIKLCFSHISMVNYPRFFKLLELLFNRLDVLQKLLRIIPITSSFNLIRHRLILVVFHTFNGTLNREKTLSHAVGFRHCHVLSSFPGGELGTILSKVSGAITVPYYLINSDFIQIARSRGLEVWVYCIDKKKKLIRYMERVGPDNVFTNNPYLITESP